MIYFDQMGNSISLSSPAKRVVSLVPSQTELLYDLGIQPIGQTIFCIHPKENFKSAVKIGGTKKLQIEAIKALNPDLIIGNKEENIKEEIEELNKDFPVWMSDVNSVADACKMIESVGNLVGKATLSKTLSDNILKDFKRLLSHKVHLKSCLYLIWNEPFMGVASNTFIHEMLPYAGFKNVLKEHARYPELSAKDIEFLNPEYILLSTEPFPFKQKHVEQLSTQFPNSKILLVDGEMFSWYGSRMLKAGRYFKDMRNEDN